MSSGRSRGRGLSITSVIRPGRGLITTILVDRNTASGIEWVTKTTVLGRSFQMRSSSKLISSRVSASRAEKGSSISRMSGSCSSDRAIDTRCCMPPDSSLGRLWAKSFKPIIASSSCARCCSFASTRPNLCRMGKVMLSSTLSQGSSVGFWNTMPISSRGSVTTWSKMRTAPLVGRSKPPIRRKIVDLPQPEGPISETNSCRRRCRSTFCSAVTGMPSLDTNVWVTSSRSITWCMERAEGGRGAPVGVATRLRSALLAAPAAG